MIRKARKLLTIVFSLNWAWIRSLRMGVAAGVEHTDALALIDCETIVDVGANRGQFALAARHSFANANIISFEPLPGPAGVFRSVFTKDGGVTLHVAAVGPHSDRRGMHISGSDDSSSLLPISSLQEEIYPGTEEVATFDVRVAPLDSFLSKDDIRARALLKLDVQGFELDALHGCESLLDCFEWIYCECSFVELYTGQKLASDVIDWLSKRGFRLTGLYNPSFDRLGKSIQGDFLFRKDIAFQETS